MTVADRRGPAPQGCRTHAALELDHARFWELVVDALRTIGDPAPALLRRRSRSHDHPRPPPGRHARRGGAGRLRGVPAQRLHAQPRAGHHGPRAGHRRRHRRPVPDDVLHPRGDVLAVPAAAVRHRGAPRVLLVMLAVMLVGSVVAALAVSVPMLFAGRILQGITGPVVPICLLMLRSEIADPRRYGVVLGLITAVNGGVAGLDALLGGWLATHHGFRSIFWVIAAVTVVALVLVACGAWSPAPRRAPGWTGAGSSRWSSRSARCCWPSTRPPRCPTRAGVSSPGTRCSPSSPRWCSGGCRAAPRSRSSRPRTCAGARDLGHARHHAADRDRVFAVVNGLVASIAQNPTAGFGLGADLTALAPARPLRADRLAGRAVRRSPGPGARLPHRAAGRAGRQRRRHRAAGGGGGALVPGAGRRDAAARRHLRRHRQHHAQRPGRAALARRPARHAPRAQRRRVQPGAGISFVVLPAVQVAVGGAEQTGAAATPRACVGAACTAGAFALSLLIPRPAAAETGAAHDAVDAR
nr:MFS transporter [Pseudonocardia sp. ICBG601]